MQQSENNNQLTREEFIDLVDEVNEMLSNLTDSEVDHDNGDDVSDYFERNTEVKKFLNMKDATYEFIEQKGGEDEGSHYHVVAFVSIAGRSAYFYWEGRYDSYNGVEWDYYDTPKKVGKFEKQVVVTEWKPL